MQETKPDLATVLEHYGIQTIHKSGWIPCKCVIHEDSHASAAYNLDHQIYHCLVCNIIGDVYELVKAKENLKGFADVKQRAEKIANGNGTTILRIPQPGDTRLPRKTRNNRNGGKYLPSWKRA